MILQFLITDKVTIYIHTLSRPFSFFFFNDTATTEIYTLSLHDALPISRRYGGHPLRRPQRLRLRRSLRAERHEGTAGPQRRSLLRGCRSVALPAPRGVQARHGRHARGAPVVAARRGPGADLRRGRAPAGERAAAAEGRHSAGPRPPRGVQQDRARPRCQGAGLSRAARAPTPPGPPRLARRPTREARRGWTGTRARPTGSASAAPTRARRSPRRS